MVGRGKILPRAGDAARARTAGEIGAELAAAGDEGGIVDDVIAVVDAIDMQDVEAVAHVRGRPAFAGMRGDMKARGARLVVHLLERRRRKWRLVVVEPDADHFLTSVGEDHVQELKPTRRPALARMRRDQQRRDALVLLGVVHRRDDPVEHRGVGHAELEMRVRAEEELDVAGAAGGAARQRFVGHAMEIVSAPNRMADEIVDDQKGGEILVDVKLAHVRFDRERHAVLGGERSESLRFDRALQVQMQLDLRQSSRKSRNVHSEPLRAIERPLVVEIL